MYDEKRAKLLQEKYGITGLELQAEAIVSADEGAKEAKTEENQGESESIKPVIAIKPVAAL